MQILPGHRQRPPFRGPLWIFALILLVSMVLIFSYLFPPQSNVACYLFLTKDCKAISTWHPPHPTRQYTDAEIASQVVIREIMTSHPVLSANPKIAFMFLTPGSLPFEKLWDKFFQVKGCFSYFIFHPSQIRDYFKSFLYFDSY